jgi:hypothetical protein
VLGVNIVKSCVINFFLDTYSPYGIVGTDKKRRYDMEYLLLLCFLVIIFEMILLLKVNRDVKYLMARDANNASDIIHLDVLYSKLSGRFSALVKEDK